MIQILMCLYITINPNPWRASMQNPRNELGFQWPNSSAGWRDLTWGHCNMSTYFFKHDEWDNCRCCEECCDDYHHDSNWNVLIETSKGWDPTTAEQQKCNQTTKLMPLSKTTTGNTGQHFWSQAMWAFFIWDHFSASHRRLLIPQIRDWPRASVPRSHRGEPQSQSASKPHPWAQEFTRLLYF